METEDEDEAARSKYTPKQPPALSSKYLDFLRQLEQTTDSSCQSSVEARTAQIRRRASNKAQNSLDRGGDEEGEDGGGGEDKDYFHCWVYVDIAEGGSFFIEATTGERIPLDDPSRRKIVALWNHENYWLSKDPLHKWNKSLKLGDQRY